MPAYSVTIQLEAANAFLLLRELERVFGAVVAGDARVIRTGEPDYFDDPCRRLGHFGCVHWTEDDLESRFATLNILSTPELLRQVKENLRHIDDEIVEVGWGIIESVIIEAAAI